MLYAEKTWDEIRALAKKNATAILVFGGTEAHGKHLPVNTDTLIPFELGRIVAGKTNSVLLPPVEYGYTYTLRSFPGTISLRSRTLELIARDIVRELVRNGFKRILILNGHGGNASIIKNALKELSDELPFRACVVSWWEMPELKTDVGHADESEASLYLYLSRTWKEREVKQEKGSSYFGSVFPSPKDVFTPSGYIGKVKKISAERGKKMADKITGKLVLLVNKGLLLKER